MEDYRAVTNYPSELVGKTIVGGEMLYEYSAFRLHFSDGSSVEVTPQGYEVEGIQLILDSPEGQASRDRQAEENKRRYQEAKARRAEREREKAIIREQKRQELSPTAFEQWLREQDSNYIMKQSWGDTLHRQLYETNPFLDLVDLDPS